MTSLKLRAVLALTFGLGIGAILASTAPAANADGGKNSAVRQASAEEASDSGDELILPELDKPVSKKSSAQRPTAPARSGSLEHQSASKKTSTSSKTGQQLTDRDQSEQADAASKRMPHPAQRNGYSQAPEVTSMARGQNRYGTTQSGAYMPASPYGTPRYAGGYPPNYPPAHGSRPMSAMYFDRNVPSDAMPMRGAQSAPAQAYPQYRADARG